MTTFTMYGLNGHELMPVQKLFKRPVVKKTQAAAAERPVDDMERSGVNEHGERHHSAGRAYSTIGQLPQSPSILLAEQVMTSPAITVTPETKTAEVLARFQSHAFHHIPVVTSTGSLVGIISDRDILRHLAGLAESYRRQAPRSAEEQVGQLMTPRVLAASTDTDVRYIARLFIEQHIGAMPVVHKGELRGIITRSDLLAAVARHYRLELWV